MGNSPQKLKCCCVLWSYEHIKYYLNYFMTIKFSYALRRDIICPPFRPIFNY